MKKISSLFVGGMISLCLLQVNGQTVLGVKGGVSVADLADDAHKARVSGHGGVYVNRVLNRYWSLQPEVLFSGEGQRYFYGVERVSAKNFIQIPLMVQFNPITQLYVEVGPQLGLLISAEDKVVRGAEHRDEKANVSTAQFAVATGLGFKATDYVTVYGRYNFGLTDLTPYDVYVHRSKVAQVGLAIRLKTL